MRGQSRVNLVEHLVHGGLRRRPRLPAGGGARRGIERVPKRRFVDLDRPTDRRHGRRSKAVRRQLRRRLAGVDEVADRAPDDRVRTAVVDVSGQREDVGDVGGGDEALACDLSEALRPQLDAVQHGRGQPGDRDRLVERSWNGAVEQVEVIRARRPGVQSGERARDVAGGLTRLRAYRGERVGILLLRHQRARATVGVRELDQTELLAGVDLEVLAELALVRRGDREGRKELEVHVGLPRGVLGVLDDSVAAEQLGESRAIERPARARTPAGPRDARPESRVRGARPVTVAKRRVGVRQEEVADGRRLCRLEVGVVGRERGARCACVPDERRGLVDERVMQLPRARTGRQPERDAKRLASWTAGAQPAGGRPSDAPLELGLACVERVAERRVPRELVVGDRVQLEQPPQERLRVLAREVAALDRVRRRARDLRATTRERDAGRGHSRPHRPPRRARPQRRRAAARPAPAPPSPSRRRH